MNRETFIDGAATIRALISCPPTSRQHVNPCDIENAFLLKTIRPLSSVGSIIKFTTSYLRHRAEQVDIYGCSPQIPPLICTTA